MLQSPNETKTGWLVKISLAFLGLVFIESLITLFVIFSVPSDPDARFFLGISLRRWIITSMVFSITAISISLFFWLAKNRGQDRLARFLSTPTTPKKLAIASAAIIPLIHLGTIFVSSSDSPVIQVGFTRLVPAIVLILVISIELFFLSCLWVRYRVFQEGKTLRLSLWLLIAFFLAAALVLSTRFGLEPTTQGWYEYGVPLVTQQVLILFEFSILILAGWIFIGLGENRARISPRIPVILVNAVLIAAIWLAAVLLWQSFPIPVTWFTPQTYPPNFEIYPNSDALLYDTSARGIMLGTRWARQDIHYKPLYVAILSLLEGFAGGSYPLVILYQTFLLALFPVTLYLLGKMLLGRLFGLLVASAAIIREGNQLSVAGLTTLSTSKLLLSELPTALGISSLLLVLVFWLQNPKDRTPFGFLAGGIIGLLIQIRLQTALFLPVLWLVLLFYYFKQWKNWLKVSAIMTVGFLLTVTPLILINFKATHTFALERPGYFSQTFAYGQSQDENSDTGGEGLNTSFGNLEGRSIAAWAASVGNHFTHNTVSTILTLPTTVESTINDLSSLAWLEYKTGLHWTSWVMLGFNLSMIAVGAAYAWRQWRLVGLLPALIYAVYNLSSAFVGFSGQRFILPVDWVGYFYFFAGLSWLAAAIFTGAGWDAFHQLPFWFHSGGQEQVSMQNSSIQSKKCAFRNISAMIAVLFSLSMLLPLQEIAIPIRYPRLEASQTRAEIMRIASAKLSAEQIASLSAHLEQPETIIISGVAIYPRAIHTPGDGKEILRYTGKSTYPVLSFLHLGADRNWVLFPLAETESISLQDSSEVLIAGTWIPGRNDEKTIQAFIVIPTDTEAIYLALP